METGFKLEISTLAADIKKLNPFTLVLEHNANILAPQELCAL